ncbi:MULTISPECIES: hypothetical protein [Oceanospirillaceae]|jgi:hypothetical protein|uniref:Uncharacterized protein n=1 Tax=Oceanobacter antarcticus TaxID=3133425 RepID=A0ABW8NHK0_9GAMM|tara:strand:- start:7479 stop:7607 length:129 start_codon:yes stop_codon:yes gene_type:complete
MKKPDLLVFIGLVVILGAAITGMTINENQRPSAVLASEHTIR